MVSDSEREVLCAIVEELLPGDVPPEFEDLWRHDGEGDEEGDEEGDVYVSTGLSELDER